MGATAPKDSEANAAHEYVLVVRAKARSPEAWSEIYNRYYPFIFRYVKARIFDQATAEDLASVVFVRALEGIKSYRYQGRPFLAWLYGIARNVVASHRRQLLASQGKSSEKLGALRRTVWPFIRHLPYDGTPANDPELLPDTSSQGNPDLLVDRLDLRDALARLTEGQREAVILRFLVGLTTHEVADIMGKKPAAVYSLQARALLSLQEQLR